MHCPGKWRLTTLLAGLILAGMLACGCERDKPSAPAAKRRLSVMGTVYPLANIARVIGGDDVEVEWAVERGQSTADYSPSAEIRQRIRQADMVISGGIGEDWAVEGFDDPARARSIIRLDLLESAREPVSNGARQLWLDPMIASEAAGVFADRLVLRRPDHAAQFKTNARQFCAQIEKLMSDFDPKIKSIEGRKVLVFSNDFSALTQRLGLIEITAPGESPLRVRDEDLAAIRTLIREQSPVALLIDIDTPVSVQQDLAQRLKLPIVPLESLGTSAGVGRNSYLTITGYNLEQLTALPAGKESH